MGKNAAPCSVEAVRALEIARDSLLAGSQGAGAEAAWELARKLVDLAARADALRDDVRAALAASDGQVESPAAPLPPPRLRALSPPRPGAGEFPRFFVRGGQLVKQGLQKTGNDVYEHAVPRDHFEQIVQELTNLAERQTGRAKEFSVERVSRSVRSLPRYMVYVIVSFLVHKGLVQQIRKGAYQFAAPATFAAAAAAVWLEMENATQS